MAILFPFQPFILESFKGYGEKKQLLRAALDTHDGNAINMVCLTVYCSCDSPYSVTSYHIMSSIFTSSSVTCAGATPVVVIFPGSISTGITSAGVTSSGVTSASIPYSSVASVGFTSVGVTSSNVMCHYLTTEVCDVCLCDNYLSL